LIQPSSTTSLTNSLFAATSISSATTVKPTKNEWNVNSVPLTLIQSVTVVSKVMSANRVVICPECKKEIEVRSGFAHHTLARHMKEHKK
jgi:hypothetical protein